MMKFYIISTIISIVVIFISLYSIDGQIKREGYKRVYRASTGEIVRGWMLTLIPILNILMALVGIFCYDEVLETTKKEYWVKEAETL